MMAADAPVRRSPNSFRMSSSACRNPLPPPPSVMLIKPWSILNGNVMTEKAISVIEPAIVPRTPMKLLAAFTEKSKPSFKPSRATARTPIPLAFLLTSVSVFSSLSPPELAPRRLLVILSMEPWVVLA